jgi:hypothetical protein
MSMDNLNIFRLDVISKVCTIVNELEEAGGVAGLVERGKTILKELKKFKSEHPYVTGAITVAVLAKYAPDILRLLSYWVTDVRQASHQLNRSIRSSIEELNSAIETNRQQQPQTNQDRDRNVVYN